MLAFLPAFNGAVLLIIATAVTVGTLHRIATSPQGGTDD